MRQSFTTERRKLYQAVTVTRQGLTVGTGIFHAKFALRDSRVHGHEGPLIDKGQKWPMLFFEDVRAPIQVGDLIKTVDRKLYKAYDVRGWPAYADSLQVDLQRIDYPPCGLWSPGTVASATQNYRLGQPTYTKRAAAVLAYLEPMGEQSKAYVVVSIPGATLRTATAFTIEPLAAKQVITVSYQQAGNTVNECWEALANSDHFPVTEDYRTVMQLLIQAPVGVSFT